MEADVVVVGGGVVGASIARELSRYNLRGILVEREADVASGTSKANTGIIHAGYNPEPGTLKARLNVIGNRLCGRIAKELDVPFKRIGSLLLAFNGSEVNTLRNLKARGEKNGVPDLKIVYRDELLGIEPHINPDTVAALHAPTAGIVNPFEITIANIENAVENGIRVLLETRVVGIEQKGGRVKAVNTNKGRIRTGYVVNAAGLYSDEVASMAGPCSFTITPRRGEYMVLDKSVGGLVDSVVFPTPTPITKGIVVTPTTDGNILIGPTAEDIEDKSDVSTSSEWLKRIIEGAKRLVPRVSLRDVISSFSGIRAVSNTDDFVISPHEEVEGFINVDGIQSPGLAAAPAIALMVVELLHDQGMSLVPKEEFNPNRRGIPKFREASYEEKKSLIANDPRYGRIVCRCETVTEAEVVEAIHRPLSAKTVDGVKFRARAGMGRCHGGFCGPRVVNILARELGLNLNEVTKRSFGSRILTGRDRRVG